MLSKNYVAYLSSKRLMYDLTFEDLFGLQLTFLLYFDEIESYFIDLFGNKDL